MSSVSLVSLGWTVSFKSFIALGCRVAANHQTPLIAKATDENLTSENWEFIMDVCDKVTTEDSGAKDAVASMIRRLAHRNANVQLYTLEVGIMEQGLICTLIFFT
jgi:hypothetical protein